MKRFMLAVVALAVLALVPMDATAGWVVRIVYRWDPSCCRYMSCSERHWVPEPWGSSYSPYDGVPYGRGYGGYPYRSPYDAVTPGLGNPWDSGYSPHTHGHGRTVPYYRR